MKKKFSLIAALLLVVMNVVVFKAQAVEIGDGETTLVISNFDGSAGNGQISLSWSASPDKNGADPAAYLVHYGTESVAEDLADSYENTIETNESQANINNLQNGVPYYFAVQAIGQDGTEGEFSREVSLTPSETSEAPTVIAATALSSTEVLVEFSKEVVLPEDSPELAFSIVDQDDETMFLLLWGAEYYTENEGTETEAVDQSKVVVTTEEQVPGVTYVLTVGALIVDNEGNPIASGVTDTATFEGHTGNEPQDLAANTTTNADPINPTGERPAAGDDPESDPDANIAPPPIPDINSPEENPEIAQANEPDPTADPVDNPVAQPVTDEPADPVAPEAPATPEVTATQETVVDTTPPENVTNLVTSFTERMDDFLIQLSWTPSINSAGDLVDQIVYHSLDAGNNWENTEEVGIDATSYEVAGEPESEHFFKVATVDDSGNESTGTTATVRLPALAQTGPLALALLGFGLTTAGTIYRKRK